MRVPVLCGVLSVPVLSLHVSNASTPDSPDGYALMDTAATSTWAADRVVARDSDRAIHFRF